MKKSQTFNKNALKGFGATEKRELIEAIRDNLVNGDMKDIAEKNNISVDKLWNTTKHRSFKLEIVQLLYDRALENRKKWKAGIIKMTQNLRD